MSRLIIVLLLAAFVAAQIPEGCVDCGLPDHPNCQVCSLSVRNIWGLQCIGAPVQHIILNIPERNIPDHPNCQIYTSSVCNISIAAVQFISDSSAYMPKNELSFTILIVCNKHSLYLGLYREAITRLI